MIRRTSTARAVLVLLLAVPLLSACNDETLMSPTAADSLFVRYASLGNSLTAGIQSGGINDSTQAEAYPVLVAQAMQTEFIVPFLRSPGCPPPLVNIFTQERLGGGAAPPCALREDPIPERINNLAIPGAEVIELINYFDPGLVPSETDTYKTFLLGGFTPVQAAAPVQPTFVSIAIGSNDLLGAALDGNNPGDPSLVTPPAEFAARYDAVLDSLDAIGSIEGGVLIGVQPLQLPTGASVPYFSPGAAWQQFEVAFDQLTAPLNALDVSAACATVFVPFPVGATTLALANARVDSVRNGLLPPLNLVPATLACTDETVIVAAEWLNLVAAATAYNTAIQQAAEDRGWAYYDPAAVFQQLVAQQPVPDAVDRPHAAFGFAMSRDGIHWSDVTHEAIAGALVDEINDHYGTSLGAP